jgi:CheY-like chemotaxis protein/HPt (histidine-containing phosphotransfer) domain-containing protein
VAGTGLGLAICQRLVDLMHGELGVESEPGAGSTFWFEIPVRLAHKESAALSVSSKPESRGRRLNILVAEDIEANRTVIGAMLQSLGHQTDMVEDGEQAIAAAVGRGYDVILMDIQMPRLNGLDAIRAIRNHGGRLAQVPIFAVTALAQESDREEAMNAGAEGYLTKPVRKNDLRSVLDGVVEDGVRAEDPPAAPEFDEAALAELREDLGNESFVRLLGKCVEDVTARLAKLEAATGDDKQIRALAHQLKGLFAQFGATGAARAASEAETCGGDTVAECVSALRASAAAALHRFESLRNAKS